MFITSVKYVVHKIVNGVMEALEFLEKVGY